LAEKWGQKNECEKKRAGAHMCSPLPSFLTSFSAIYAEAKKASRIPLALMKFALSRAC
jgi:hypothetical protein